MTRSMSFLLLSKSSRMNPRERKALYNLQLHANGLGVISTTPDRLDDIKSKYDFLYFTIGKRGKAQYHMFHLPDNSCGIYYALRCTDEGLEGRRAVEPTQTINCFIKK